MTHGAGGSIEGAPTACPFVALEDDRDARSNVPDPRHRCYAESVPAPRTLDHQERFCVSPNFAGCPIFAEWAVRAAARPVAGAAAAGVAAAEEPAPELWVERFEKTVEPPREEHWPDSMDATPTAGVLVTPAESDSDPQQMAAFEAAPAPPQPPVFAEPTVSAAPGAGTDNRDFDPAPLPTFLSARSPRARASSDYEPADERTAPVTEPTMHRSPPARRDGDGDGSFTRLLTLAAVVIILALGVATVLIVPGLLAGNPGQTARPSFVAGVSRPPTPLATGVAVGPTVPPGAATVAPTSEVPTPVATPTPTPRTYRIQAGDRLRRIARDHGVTVEQILAANPEISDANDIQVGQRILIPTP